MSTGSWDEASNLVKDPTSPLSLADVDDVFDKLGDTDGTTAAGDDGNNKPSAASTAAVGKEAKLTPKHGLFKKPKSSKGLGFLIKAREGAKKSRSKSPLALKSKSKKHREHEDDDDDFLGEFGVGNGEEGEVDDNVKAKSEHWQVFQQMQERIKQNVLKTQTSLGKLASGRISPSGHISPATGRDEDLTSSIRFANLNEQDSGNSDQGTDNTSHTFAEEDSNNISNYYESSDLANLISIPQFTVSSPSAFHTSSEPESNFSMEPDALQNMMDLGSHAAASSQSAPTLVEEFDLLGFSSDASTAVPAHKVSQQSSLNEDLLGLDDFMSQPVSRDMSQENLTTDWLAGFSTAESSAQSSLCPSPVQFDLDTFVNQGRLVPESTAVSDLARSLVDDFLQWGAGKADEPLSKNPFQSDDFACEQSLKSSTFNPFATIVESDDPDAGCDFLAGGYHDRAAPEQVIPDTTTDPFLINNLAPDRTTDPFLTDNLAPDRTTDPFLTDNLPTATKDMTCVMSYVDPFAASSAAGFSVPLDINANAAAPVCAAPTPPARPPQHSHSRKSSRKSSNPFLLTDDDFVGGQITFDDNFFASRGIFHAPSKDQESIWGVSTAAESQAALTGASSGPTANPFQDDLFTSDNFSATRDQAFGFGEETSNLQPVNPFLTASFENIASQAQSQPFSTDNPFATMVADSSPALSPVHSPTRVRSPPSSVGTDTLLNAGLDITKGNQPLADIDVNFDPLASIPATSVQPLAAAGDLLGGQDRAPPSAAAAADDDEEPSGGGLRLTIKSISQVGPSVSGPVPMLPPPPPKVAKSPLMPQRENPFNKESPPEENFASFAEIEEEMKKKSESDVTAVPEKKEYVRSLTSEDSSPEEEGPLEPLEPFHLQENKEFWRLMVRQPTKKKLAGNRFWKMAIVRLGTSKDGPVVRLYMEEKDTEPFQELPLQPCYSVSDVSMQQYDQFGKIHTVKIQYIFYRERVGIRPERITPSFVRKPKPNMILDHAPQVSELVKLGSLDVEEIISFVWAMEDVLMKLECHRDKTLAYTKDEVQAEVWDEYYAVIDKDGHVASQKARVRIFFLAFLTGMPACELGISDRRRKGKEVVGRHDIIPVRTEDWIRIEDPEFHHVVDLDTYNKTHNIRFHPLDACQFELVRFRVRPRANRELPLQLRITQLMKGRHFEVRVDLLVTGYHAFSKKCGQFPCEDIEVRIKVPEVWIYYFRYEKRFGYGSLKAMARKPGKIKGLERITVMAQGLLTPALMEASVGSAKYEHLYRSVVWRIPRLPERNHGAYKNHLFVLHLALGQHDEIPDQLEQWADVSFTMPASTVSKAQVRSISVDNPDPPEKWVRYIAKYQYKVEIDNQVETESDKETSD